MATKAGIEVTQLRPQAQARDFYVRPERQDSGIQSALNKLSNTIGKKQDEEDKARAMELAMMNAVSLDNVQAIHNNEALASESPAVIGYYQETMANNLANQWYGQLQKKWEQQRNTYDITDMSGTQFETFMSEEKASFVEQLGGNKFMLAGASGVMNQAELNIRALNRQYQNQRVKEGAVNQFNLKIGSTASQLHNAEITLADAKASIEAEIKLANDTGSITRGEASKQSFSSLLDYYKTNGGHYVLQLAKQHTFATGPNGKAPTNIQAINAINEAVQQRALTEERNANSIRLAQERADKETTEQAGKDIMALLVSDPNAAVPPEVQMNYINAGGELNKIETWRAAAQKMMDTAESKGQHTGYLGAIQKIRESAYDPSKSVDVDYINTQVGLGFIHPSRAKELYDMVDTAHKATPLLQKKGVTDARARFVESIVGVSAKYSATLRERGARLQQAFDEMFHEEVAQWYRDGNDAPPTPTELMGITKSISAELKAVADNESAEISAERARARTIRETVKASKDSNQVSWFDSEPAEIRKGINPEMWKTLKFNPNRVIPYPASEGSGEGPAWKWVDKKWGDGAWAILYSEYETEF